MPAAHDGLSKAQVCLWYSLANWEDKMLRFRSRSVADLGGGGRAAPALFWVKKELKGKRPAGKVNQDPPPPPPPRPLAQGLNPPLKITIKTNT